MTQRYAVQLIGFRIVNKYIRDGITCSEEEDSCRSPFPDEPLGDDGEWKTGITEEIVTAMRLE